MEPSSYEPSGDAHNKPVPRLSAGFAGGVLASGIVGSMGLNFFNESAEIDLALWGVVVMVLVGVIVVSASAYFLRSRLDPDAPLFFHGVWWGLAYPVGYWLLDFGVEHLVGKESVLVPAIALVYLIGLPLACVLFRARKRPE